MRAVVWARLGLAMVALLALGWAAQGVRSARAADTLQVSGAYALPDTKSPQLGYVYLTISAANGVDALTGGSTPAARAVVLVDPGHRGTVPNPADPVAIRIDSHVPLVLQPRGPHLILKGLAKPLRPGSSIHVTLTFQRAPSVDVPVEVLSKTPAAGAPKLPKGVKID